MKLTLQIQLLPDKKQADQLKSTMERFNQACSWLAEQAFEIKTANKISLQLIPVDPRNTSRTCPKCGHMEKGNRTARGLFLCRACGHFDHADIVGATNIACAAKVAWREVAEPRLTAAAKYSDKLHLQRVSV